MKKLLATAFLTLSLTVAPSASAYEIQAKLDRAMVEYNKNEIGKAANTLTEVSDYLRGIKAAALSKFLPDAPEGWTAETASSSGGSLMGGSSRSERAYTKGEEKTTVIFMTDNKLVASMLSMLSQASETNSEHLKMHKGFIYTLDKVENSDLSVFNLYVSENLVVSVKSKDLTEELATKFVDKIDIAKLKEEADR